MDRARRLYAGCNGEVVGSEVRFPSGAKIITGHLKDENSYTKYQGHEYQKMVIEELNQIPRELDYLMLLASCRSTTAAIEPQIFCTANPGGVGHNWVKERFGIIGTPREHIITTDKISGRKRIFVPSRIEDNPTLLKADPQYINFLNSLPDALKKAWKDGNWDVFAGQYFAEWDHARHVVEPFTIPGSWRRFRSIDPSGRSGTTSCHWYALDSDGTVWVYREHYKTGMDIDEHAKAIKRLSDDKDGVSEPYGYTVIDSAAFAKAGYSETAAEIYERHGVVGLISSAKERVVGWNAVHQYLRWDEQNKPRLRIFSTCKEMIRTLPLLQHDERHPEDVDSSGDDHAGDDLRYFLRTLREQKAPKPETMIERRLRQLKQEGQFDYSYTH